MPERPVSRDASSGPVRSAITGSRAGLDSLRRVVLAPPVLPREPESVTRDVTDVKSRWSLSAWLPIASLVVLYVTLATAYNLSIPLYEAPDEPAHVGYVDALQRTGRIPEITPETYEAAGPPLYHAGGAVALRLLGLSPPRISLPNNPDFAAHGPNAFLHTPGENDLPFRGPVLSIHLLRAISTMLGAGAVAVVYLIVRLLFPGRPLLAWAAGANTALLPQFAFVGGSVMNDTTVAFFSAVTVYASLRLIQGASWRWIALAAGSLALGFLTEASMIIPAAISALAVLLSSLSWRSRLTALAVLAGVPFIVAGWFYIGNLVRWGDVYPYEAITDLNPGLPLSHTNYRGIFQYTLDRSYWYTGGWMNVNVVGAMYQFLDFLAGTAVGGMVVVVARRSLTSLQQRGLVLLTALLLLAFLEVVLISIRISFQPQGRFLFTAQPAIALILALGISALFQRDTQRDHVAALLLPAVLFGLNLGILTLTLPTVY